MKKLKILLCLLLLPLTGCSSEEDLTIYEGYIVDKIFDEGYRYCTYVQSGKTRVPIWHTVPDRWYVIIYKDEQISKHQVTQEFYNTFTIGSYVDLDGGGE